MHRGKRAVVLDLPTTPERGGKTQVVIQAAAARLHGYADSGPFVGELSTCSYAKYEASAGETVDGRSLLHSCHRLA